MDYLTAGDKRILDIHRLEKLRHDAYENAIIYEERTKACHDKRIARKEFNLGGIVLLFNSKLRFFPGKLCSRWTGPYEVTKVMKSGVVEIQNQSCSPFIVSGKSLKYYNLGDIPTYYAFHTLIEPLIATLTM